MSKLTDKISYLKGLADGMKLNVEKDNNKLLLEMLDAMYDMAQELEDVNDSIDELEVYADELDSDLADLEDALFEDDTDVYEYVGDEDEDDDDDEIITYDCPHCGHVMSFNASEVDFSEDYTCPECGKPVFPELDEEEEDDILDTED